MCRTAVGRTWTKARVLASWSGSIGKRTHPAYVYGFVDRDWRTRAWWPSNSLRVSRVGTRILAAWGLFTLVLPVFLHPCRAVLCWVAHANVFLVPPSLRALHTPDVPAILSSIVYHVHTSLARQTYNFGNLGVYQSSALSVRDNLLVRFCPTSPRLCPHPDRRTPREQVSWNEMPLHSSRNARARVLPLPQCPHGPRPRRRPPPGAQAASRGSDVAVRQGPRERGTGSPRAHLRGYWQRYK